MGVSKSSSGVGVDLSVGPANDVGDQGCRR